LGGKSPCIVDKTVDIGVAARRIAWGRFQNCGQTCIAPDYILCEKSVQDQLVEGIRNSLEDFYGKEPKQSSDYARIVTLNHFNRISKLLESGKVVIGGQTDAKDLYIAPTVLVDVDRNSPVMQQEIFGPILPIVNINSIDDAIAYVNSKEKPLSLYVFTTDRSVSNKVLNNTSSGSVVCNDCLMQATVDTLPFGGVGPSGMGAYHGKLTFEVFSHKKSCMVKDLRLEKINDLRYPPYTERKLGWILWLAGKKPKETGAISTLVSVKGVTVVGAIVGSVLAFNPFGIVELIGARSFVNAICAFFGV